MTWGHIPKGKVRGEVISLQGTAGPCTPDTQAWVALALTMTLCCHRQTDGWVIGIGLQAGMQVSILSLVRGHGTPVSSHVRSKWWSCVSRREHSGAQ